MAGDFTDFASFWPARSGRGLRGMVDKRADLEDVITKLRAGWTILMFENSRRDRENSPTHKLVLAPPMERSQGQGHRADAPSQHVGQRRSQQAMNMQRPMPEEEIPW